VELTNTGGGDWKIRVRKFSDDSKTIEVVHSFHPNDDLVVTDDRSVIAQLKAGGKELRLMSSRSDINVSVKQTLNIPGGNMFKVNGLPCSLTHVWFNPLLEGAWPALEGGAENQGGGNAANSPIIMSGVFEIKSEDCDGIKGSRRLHGIKTYDVMKVHWRLVEKGDMRGELKDDDETEEWEQVTERNVDENGATNSTLLPGALSSAPSSSWSTSVPSLETGSGSGSGSESAAAGNAPVA